MRTLAIFALLCAACACVSRPTPSRGPAANPAGGMVLWCQGDRMYARQQDGGTDDMGTGLVGIDETPPAPAIDDGVATLYVDAGTAPLTFLPAPEEVARAFPRGDFICEDEGRVLFRVGPIVGDGDGATVRGQPISALVQRCLAAGHKRVAYEEPYR